LLVFARAWLVLVLSLPGVGQGPSPNTPQETVYFTYCHSHHTGGAESPSRRTTLSVTQTPVTPPTTPSSPTMKKPPPEGKLDLFPA